MRKAKRETAKLLLRNGSFLFVGAHNGSRLVVPRHLYRFARLHFIFKRDDPELEVADLGISGTLSYGPRGMFHTFVPWAYVYIMQSANGNMVGWDTVTPAKRKVPRKPATVVDLAAYRRRNTHV